MNIIPQVGLHTFLQRSPGCRHVTRASSKVVKLGSKRPFYNLELCPRCHQFAFHGGKTSMAPRFAYLSADAQLSKTHETSFAVSSSTFASISAFHILSVMVLVLGVIIKYLILKRPSLVEKLTRHDSLTSRYCQLLTLNRLKRHDPLLSVSGLLVTSRDGGTASIGTPPILRSLAAARD